jgi:hypothetical protein
LAVELAAVVKAKDELEVAQAQHKAAKAAAEHLSEEARVQAENERKRLQVDLELAVQEKRLMEVAKATSDAQYAAEKLALVQERDNVYESARKVEQELCVHREEAAQRAADSISESNSHPRGRRRGSSSGGNGAKNNIVVGASAVAGGLSILALKLLANGGNR